ncbi:protein FAR1-RELATED SEQUENCE 1 [Neltuma alba]|uniref:protein FAR1-RELATED SEQUENCE 1 n=1 Tax=Neltuma alba TaxID=207710 RepID=UPI0010A3B79C|nr:protein FAR1-RELATED SEQUENCE 1-like [Prosopis alba]XP_028803396.1 protein FAR1-RELATED SEQUENCE 1-like [Prosopis alba]XP_028803397.1 protein FAR1-RELATED SEQUENCE 1-like [Prosopis alba]
MEASLDDGNRIVLTYGDAGMSAHEVHINQEPYEGMSFESEKAAREFYDNYASREGFTTRVLSSRKSEQDGSIISRGLGCRGVGRIKTAIEKQDRQNVCTAMILLKREKDGEWVIRKFVKDHNHPVMVDSEKTPRTLDEKDKKIQELTAEVRVKKRLSASYREQLEALLKDIEGHGEHISKKIHSVNETLRKLDAEMGKHPKMDK